MLSLSTLLSSANISQSTILHNGVQGKKPIFTCMPYEWEAAARKVLSADSDSYVFSGAGGWETMEANRRAFNQWKIIPRMLRKSKTRSVLFGSKLRAPVILAPVGVQKIFHVQGKSAGAEIAAELGIGWCMSTASSQPVAAQRLGQRLQPLPTGRRDAMGFEDPVFRAEHKQRTGKEVEDDIMAAAAAWVGTTMSGSTHEWSDLTFLRKM